MADNNLILWLVPIIIVVAAIGTLAGYYARRVLSARKVKAYEEDTLKVHSEAKTKAREAILEAKDEAIRIRAAAEAENRDRRAEIQRLERRLTQKEETLDKKLEAIDRRDKSIAVKEKEAEALRAQAEDLRRQQRQEMERVARLSTDEAKELLLKAIEDEVRQDASRRIRNIETQFKEESERRAREIIALSLQRCATDVVSETVVSTVPLPNEEMKGRIIGREGRNIRALEQATGVDLIIDDTPDAVTLSAFDPVRREVARIALNKLILDGRIHPARIEEVVQKARHEVEATIREEGEQAAYKAGVHGLHADLIKLLGRLKYRYSYGQNVLQHSLEVTFLAGVMASELGADVNVCKRAGLLHDIGKAVDHEVEGPHALIGADIAKRFSTAPKVVHAIASHHGEEEPVSVEAFIVSTADAISGARPGARRESLEHYVKRLEALETVANSFPGVEKSFAIQAGREVRIIVKPEEIDDLASVRLARDIVKKIEDSLDYPGQIKVTVIRETRAVDYAK
ncbi:MAG: ribonuclease Y [Dehalococcoidia bacterium]|nr:ribonuclease Y [Dehalococcoidia bacterium]